MSGRTVAQVDEDELLDMVEHGKSFLHLKQLLSAKLGHSRFRQRLLSDSMGELHDGMPLTPVSSVQLVILDFCAPDETKWDELVQGCRGKLKACFRNRTIPTGEVVLSMLCPFISWLTEGTWRLSDCCLRLELTKMQQ